MRVRPRFARFAPGMAEALIATAFGLFCGDSCSDLVQPFIYELRNLGGQLDDLQVELLAAIERGRRSDGDLHARRQDADHAGRNQHDSVHR